ncbi:MAG: carbohydrate ABC transporter permease [Acidimicrobiia bacterium]|nr:carbohydrate ABC transporter permease [Acidimicrobiia bacterium]MDH4307595.1 carbohydrate ABC transporter permease [Acidimicrobiia bacterium]MDH5294922.1 carbohydrate ABC transporter permease [Acidimicrobiia bacterium]
MVDTAIDAARAGTDRHVAGQSKSPMARFGRKLLVGLPLFLLGAWTFIPFIITLSVSLKTKVEAFSDLGLIPRNPTLTAYQDVLADPNFTSAFLNSVIVGFGTAALTIIMGLPAAYAFARFQFRGRHLLLLFTLLPRLVPSIGIMVPIYRLAVATGMLDKRITLIIVYTGMLVPLAVWLMVGFFQQIPRDIEEAADVDGASIWARIRYIVMPLAAPALITIAVLAFREAWNEFTLVLVLTTSPENRTLPFALFKLGQSEGISNFPIEAAFAMITVVPFILVYTRIERYVVAGLTSGSSK